VGGGGVESEFSDQLWLWPRRTIVTYYVTATGTFVASKYPFCPVIMVLGWSKLTKKAEKTKIKNQTYTKNLQVLFLLLFSNFVIVYHAWTAYCVDK
jgi:hypothetical protein